MTELTKDADKMLCIFYKEYLSRRKSGSTKSDAKLFGDAYHLKSTLFTDMSVSDISDTIRELDRADYASVSYADNEVDLFELSDSCIVKMENRFKNGFLGVTDFISKFIP